MSEIQSVSVFSVDEERLKYRVICAIDADQPAIVRNTQGTYQVNFPIPTAFANNRNYNQCLIKCDSFVAQTDQGVNDPSWEGERGNNLLKIPAIEIKLSIPSSQTTLNSIGTANQIASGGSPLIGGFRQLMPLQIVNVGDTAGAAVAAGGFAWTAIGSGVAATDPLLCANPFGQKITVNLRDVITDTNIWLGSAAQHAAGNFIDRGSYIFQFTITMIPNDRSEGTD